MEGTLKRLKELRLKAGYTQEYVGKYLGCLQESYSKVENGKTELKSETICALSKLYGVSTDYILIGEEKIKN